MRGVWTIASREIAGLFRLPVGWIVVALYAFLSAVVFVQYALVPGVPATMRYFFAAAAWMMVPVAPAISMRLLAEESRSGTIEMLRTSPASDGAIALGKFLGAWIFLGITLAPTLLLPITLALVSEPTIDPGPVVTGYLVLICFGGLCLGVGLVASSLTSSQTLAFLGTLMALVLMLMLSGPIAGTLGPRFGEPLRALSVMARVTELSKGVLDTGALAFFLIGIVWSIVLTAGVLASRRVTRPRPVSAAIWAAFIVATGTSAILAGVLTTDHRVRLDVTSTGAHKLGPRAQQMIGLLDAPTEIVFAIDRTRADRHAPDHVGDVLSAYDRASDWITYRPIDLSDARGIEATDRLIVDLAQRDQDRIARNTASVEANRQEMLAAAADLGLLAAELDRVRDAISPAEPGADTNRAFFEQRAGLARLGARTLMEQAEGIESGLAAATGTGVPAFDRIAPPASGVWKTQRTQLSDLADQARAFAESGLGSENARALARAVSEHAGRLRDRAAIAQERLDRLPQIDALRVARALETGEALLVIGPPELGVAAVDLNALLPSSEVLERAGVSAAGFIGPRTQELVATAIGRLVRPERPIVVFAHGGRPGELLGSGEYFAKVIERFAQRGIDAVEWAAAEELEPPELGSLDPAGARPTVYIVISADSTTGSGEGRMTGAQRTQQLAAAVERLIESGENVLLSLNPSVFPTYGDIDPMARLAEPYGISARTGTTLLRDRVGAGGRQADPITIAVSDAEDHAVADAVSGLRTALPWAVPMELTEAEDAKSWALVTLTGTDAEAAWAESGWQRLWGTESNRRQLLREQPEYNVGADTRSDRWILAAAGERSGRFGTQRMIVVGSNGWATDSVVASVEQMVDGRITTRFPGNGTLLDTSITWLAGQDELIAPGTDARPVATVKALTPSQLSTVRWMLLGVVPGVILIGGAAFRGIRG